MFSELEGGATIKKSPKVIIAVPSIERDYNCVLNAYTPKKDFNYIYEEGVAASPFSKVYTQKMQKGFGKIAGLF